MSVIYFKQDSRSSNSNVNYSTLPNINTNDCCYLTLNQTCHNNQNLKQSCMKKKVSKNYYHLPGYTGKIPQESYMFGLTRSEMSRRIFHNSYIHTRPDTLFSPTIDSIDDQTFDIRANSSITDQIYMSDIITSGYTGHIPTIQEKFGKNMKNLFLKSIIDFENDQTEKRYYKLDFKLQKLLDDNSITKQDLPTDSMVMNRVLC
ncbi:unnamed protein product [Rotaria sp. Silwood1]|nr:unnamed protein product [Rotaria sp. Silwood1]